MQELRAARFSCWTCRKEQLHMEDFCCKPPDMRRNESCFCASETFVCWRRRTHGLGASGSLELFYFEHQPEPKDASLLLLKGVSGGKWLHPGGGDAPEPRRAARPEEETSFTGKHEEEEEEEEGVQLTQSSSSELYEEEEVMEEEEEEDIQELYLLSDDDLSTDGSGKSVDYGFIIAVTCLVTGISLVAISYTVPRDVRVDPDSVSAREMERLEREKARVGAHLDRCVIAGLCLLTLGGVLLSTLLMVSMWKGEMMRRRAFAFSKHAARLYGSVSLRGGSSPTHLSADEDLEALS